MQDLIALVVTAVAGLWIARTLWRRLSAPTCGRPETPSGADGFVPLDAVTRTARDTRNNTTP